MMDHDAVLDEQYERKHNREIYAQPGTLTL